MNEKKNTSSNVPSEKDYQDAVLAPERKLENAKYISTDFSAPPQQGALQQLDLTDNIKPEYSVAPVQQYSTEQYNQGFNQGNISAQYGQYSVPQQENAAAAGHIISNFLPFGLLTSGIGYYSFGKKGAYLKEQMRSLFNFQLTLVPVSFALGVLGLFEPDLAIYGSIGLGGFSMACGVMGAVAAKKGKDFKYPGLEFIKNRSQNTALPVQQQYNQLPPQQGHGPYQY
ncbi:MAG: DUF4870 domain-containing protein [Micrococcaceae bacterium]